MQSNVLIVFSVYKKSGRDNSYSIFLTFFREVIYINSFHYPALWQADFQVRGECYREVRLKHFH
jgi:hypothetical protein